MTRRIGTIMTVGALAIIVSLGAFSVANAQGRRARAKTDKTPAAANMRQEAAKKLNLTDDQKDKLAAIREDLSRKETLLRGQMADVGAQLRVEFMNDNLDKAKIRSLEKQISDLRAQAADARLEARLDAHDVFTPEQRAELKKMRGFGNRGFMGRGHGRMMGRRGAWGRGFGRGMGPGMGQGMQPGTCPGMGRGMGQGMGRGMGRGMGSGMAPRGQGQGMGSSLNDDTGPAFGFLPQDDAQAPMLGMEWFDDGDGLLGPPDVGPWWVGDEALPGPAAPPEVPTPPAEPTQK